MTTLHDRLADLADQAPVGGAAPDLWSRGVRRHRRRRAVGAAAALVVGLVGVTGVLAGLRSDPAPQPAQVPFEQLHLPRTAYPPSPWAAGTDETGAPGRLAFVSVAERNQTRGVRETTQLFQPFGMSAVDGSSVFLDLPDTRTELGFYALTLSPDGTKVGYVRYAGRNRIKGWGVYDTITGRTTMLRDPDMARIRNEETSGLAFSGDSRYLETVYSLTGSKASRQKSLVLWDVRSGQPLEAEPAGHYWQPNLGSGPSGTVWSRHSTTFTFEPDTGATTSVDTPFRVVEASVAPDGRGRAFVAFGPTDRASRPLYVGTRANDLMRVLVGVDADDLLGWSDAEHVVVRQLRTGETVEVDITTGRATSLGLDVTGRQMVRPTYAADLWANPLVAGERPPDPHDPRLPAWIAAGVAAVVALAGFVARRRRRVRA